MQPMGFLHSSNLYDELVDFDRGKRHCDEDTRKANEDDPIEVEGFMIEILQIKDTSFENREVIDSIEELCIKPVKPQVNLQQVDQTIEPSKEGLNNLLDKEKTRPIK